MRFRLMILALLTGCGPLVCQTLNVDVYPVAGKPKTAGRVVLKCDGQAVLEAVGSTVTAVAP